MVEIQPPNNMLLFRIVNLNTSVSKANWNTNYIVPPSVGLSILSKLLLHFHGKSVGLMVNWTDEIIMAKLAKDRAGDKRKRSMGIIDDCESFVEGHLEELELGAINEREDQGFQNFSNVMEVAWDVVGQLPLEWSQIRVMLTPLQMLPLWIPQTYSTSNVLSFGPFEPDEVKTALFQMPDYKSPRPDGFPAEFYKKNWDIVGKDVTLATLEFLNRSNLLKEINNTLIILIPKVDNPFNMADYRPISLCNAIYKIASKVLVNRLKPFMTSLVSPFQNGFVHGRGIQDNVIMTQELTHTIRTLKCKKTGLAAIKIDMSKAFDRVK
ncbi:hypothetical protein LIER_41207 [Lithospermum erythrorhizon]|uniref:Reverse transcriptase domain-containing protein n=1 Tax=Lithospermum erythrorhizon TaxID=34254 RepID=A0AAV3R8R2_LITER